MLSRRAGVRDFDIAENVFRARALDRFAGLRRAHRTTNVDHPPTSPMSLKHRIGSALLMIVAMTAQAQPSEPKLDLDKAVENPALVRAMDQLGTNNSEANRDQLVGELQHAEFLAAILPDDGKTPFAGPPGARIVAQGTQFDVLAAGKDGKSYLLLFTDWAQLRMYTNNKVTGWVLPASEAWAFGLQKGFDGIVINPAHNALPLRREMLQYLATHLSK